MNRDMKLGILAGAALILSACNEGRITVSVTDAPVDDAQAVVVQFRSVIFELNDGARQTVTLDTPQVLDLRQLSGGVSQALLTDQILDNGRYRAIELELDAQAGNTASFVDFANGSRLPLVVPDAKRGNLRVPVDFEIEEDSTVALTVDFDLRRSLRLNGNNTEVELHPSLRAVFDADAGTVVGAIAASRITSGCVPAVYLYTGRDVTPDDMGGTGSQPLSSSTVKLDTASGQWRYAIGFIGAGDYTLALTCAAHQDAVDKNDDIAFVARLRDVDIKAGRTTTADF